MLLRGSVSQIGCRGRTCLEETGRSKGLIRPREPLFERAASGALVRCTAPIGSIVMVRKRIDAAGQMQQQSDRKGCLTDCAGTEDFYLGKVFPPTKRMEYLEVTSVSGA